MAKNIWDTAQKGLQQDDIWTEAARSYDVGQDDVWKQAATEFAKEQQPAELPFAQKYNIFKVAAEQGLLPEWLAPKFEPPTDEERKSIKEAAIHGFRLGGVRGVKGLAGLSYMAGEFLTPQETKPVFPALNRFWNRVAKPLKEWGLQMSDACNQYFAENPEEQMQLESEGFWGQTREFFSKPELILQGSLESSTLILEGMLGTIAGGPAGGIAVMAPPIAGEVYTDSRKEGDSPKTALARSWLTGIGEATIEQWTLNKKFGLMRRLMNKTPMRKCLWEGAKLYLRGIAEEGSQEFLRNFWRWTFTDRNQAWTENIAESMAAGGPIELAMGGAFAGVGITGRMVSNPDKINRVEQVRRTVTESEKLTEEQRREINQTCDETIKDVEAGIYDQELTADQIIGGRFGLSAKEINSRFDEAEQRYRELKRKDTTKRTRAESEELAFLSRNRQDIESLIDWDTMPDLRKPKRSKTDLRALIHTLPKEMEMSDEDRRDYMELITGKRSAKEMSKKEMEQVVNYFYDIHGPYDLKEEDYSIPITVAGEQTTMRAVFDQTNTTVEELKGKEKIPDVVTWKYKEKGRHPIRKAAQFTLGIDNVPMYHLAKILDGGNEDGIFSRVFDKNIQAGYEQEAIHRKGVQDALMALTQKAGISGKDLIRLSHATNPWPKIIQEYVPIGTQTEVVNVKVNDQTFGLSWGELIEFYLWTQQEDGIRHLKQGGFVYKNVRTGPLTDETITDLRKMVEGNEQAISLVNIFNQIGEEYWKPSVNQVSATAEGREIATILKWWPLDVSQPKIVGGKIQPFSLNLIENRSYFKDRTKDTAPLNLHDALARFTTVEDAIATYYGLALPFRTARTLINDKNIWQNLKEKGYGNVQDNLRKLLDRAQRNPAGGGKLDAMLGWVLPSAYRAVLFYNPRVMMSQYTSVFNYGSFVSPKYMTHAVDIFTQGRSMVEEVLDKSPIAHERFYSGKAMFELAETAKSDAVLKHFTKKAGMENKMAAIMKYSDLGALATGWQIAKAEFADAKAGTITGKSGIWWDTKDISGIEEGWENYWQVIRDRAHYLWQRSQPSWDAYNRSTITSAPLGVTRSFFLFRSFHEKCLTMVNDAYMEFKDSGKTTDDITRFADKVAWPIAGYMTNQLLRIAISAMLYRKFKKPADIILQMILSPLAMFPILGKVAEGAFSAFFKVAAKSKRWVSPEAVESLPIELLNKTYNGATDIAYAFGYFSTGEDEKAEKAFKRGTAKIAEGVGVLCGIPSYEIRKVYKGYLEPEPLKPVKP